MAYAYQFAASGIAIIEYALTNDDLARMATAFPSNIMGTGARVARLPPDMLAWLTAHPALDQIAATLLDGPARLIRAVTSDTTTAANWFVPWHQDCTIVVPTRRASADVQHWAEQMSDHHVEPPVTVLEQMVTLRIHLDACDEDNGPLEAMLGSHTHGRLERDKIAQVVESGTPMLCLAARGDILAIRPLIVHRSQKAKQLRQCRVLHLDYAIAMTA